MFVVGDGAPEVTRDLMVRLCAADPRLRFFDNPKGPGNGEVHRAAALREATGDLVAYLADDDLWMAEHLEVLGELLDNADFAHTYPIRVEPDGSIGEWTVDLSQPWYREAMLGGTNFVPLGCAGHTMELYRRLPYGWRTKPEGTPSDLYMWQQILSVPEVRVASGSRPTLVHLPSSLRRGWPLERRLEELDDWVPRMTEPGWREKVYAAALAGSRDGATSAWQALQDHRRVLEGFRELEGALRQRERGLLDELARLRRDREEERRSLEGQLSAAREALRGREHDLATITSTRVWPWRERHLRLPGLGALLRWAAGARAGRGGR